MSQLERAAPPPSPSRLYEALDRETERICAPGSTEIEALKDLVLFEFDESLLRSPPTFKLFLTFGEGDEAIHNRMLATLKALSTILALSFRLNAYLPLKVKLWRRIFESCVTLIRGGQIFDNKPVDSSWLWAVEDERFPAFSVSMNLREEKHVDEMVEFFTTPPAHEMDEQLVAAHCTKFAPNQIAIGLEVSTSGLAPKYLRLVEQMLDRVYANPTRQFAVNALGVSDQAMDEMQLAVVLDLVQKSHETYQLEKMRVVDVIPEQSDSTGPVFAAMHKVIAAACNTGVVLSSDPVEYNAPIASSRLTSLDLSWNRLEVEHFAAFCSALRYGCQLTTISLHRVFKKVDAADRAQCWRWLAFGVFYPRSRKLNKNKTQSTQVKLEEELFLEEYGEAFAKTLADPAGELVYQGNPPKLRQQQAKAELLLCTIKQGAKFYPIVKAAPFQTPIRELGCDMELEILCQEEGWTCAVLPGIGFGWVQNDQILRMERETIDSCSSHRNDSGLEWKFDNRFDEVPPFTPELLEKFGSMLEHVGSCVRSIEFVEVDEVDTLLPVIVRRCINLERLVLRSSGLSDDALDTLVEALNGDFGTHLLSLVLDAESNFDNESVDTLCEALSNPARTPALIELLVSIPEMNDEAYASFRRALEVNKILRFVLLDDEDSSDQYDAAAAGEDEEDREISTAPTMNERERIEMDAQGELIPFVLPLNQKLAFLSVIQHKSAVGATRHGLDSFIVSSIFKFAADRVPRIIIWGERFV